MSKKVAVLIVVALLALGTGLGFAITRSIEQVNKDASHTATAVHSDQGYNDTSASSTVDLVDLTNQTEVGINIQESGYSRPNIKIKKGTKVTWTNLDTVEHNAMAEHSGEEHAHAAPAKDEVRPDLFAGPLLTKGESYSFTFNEVGTIGYHCAPHPFMKGSIAVVE